MEKTLITPNNDEHLNPSLKKHKVDMPKNLSSQMQKIWKWDEHRIGTEALCERFGYKSEYYFKAGLTNAFVKIQQSKQGKNEISSFLKDFIQNTSKIFGACVS
jgi:hypothetical protein